MELSRRFCILDTDSWCKISWSSTQWRYVVPAPGTSRSHDKVTRVNFKSNTWWYICRCWFSHFSIFSVFQFCFQFSLKSGIQIKKYDFIFWWFWNFWFLHLSRVDLALAQWPHTFRPHYTVNPNANPASLAPRTLAYHTIIRVSTMVVNMFGLWFNGISLLIFIIDNLKFITILKRFTCQAVPVACIETIFETTLVFDFLNFKVSCVLIGHC